MFSLGAGRYYLYREPTDIRKSFDGLCGLVSERLGQNPMSGDIFIFINKPRNRMKLLRTGTTPDGSRLRKPEPDKCFVLVSLSN